MTCLVLTLLIVTLIWMSENCSCMKAIKIQIIFGAVLKSVCITPRAVSMHLFRIFQVTHPDDGQLLLEMYYWRSWKRLGPFIVPLVLTCNQSLCCLFEMNGIRKETGVLWSSNLSFNSFMGSSHLGTCLGSSHNLSKYCLLIHVSDIKYFIKARKPWLW